MYLTSRLGRTAFGSIFKSSLFVFLSLFRFSAEAAGTADALFIRSDAHRFQPRDGDERLLTAHRRAVHLAPVILAARIEYPGFHVVGERYRQDLLFDAAHERLGANGKRHFNAADQIARHPVAAGNVDLRRTSVLETENARVLQKTIDDRNDLDVFAKPGDAGNEAADASHQQLDLHAGGTGAIKGLDDGRLDERVHLRRDSRRLSVACVLRLPLDHLQDPLVIIDRGDDELAPAKRSIGSLHQLVHSGDAVAGQKIHELRGVGAERRVAGEEIE